MVTNKKKFKFFYVVVLILALSFGLVYSYIHFVREDGSDINGKVGSVSRASSFGDGNTIYECSKEIEVRFEGSFLGPGSIYKPVDQEEFQKYCRSTGVAIEYHAVLDILKRPDIDEVISKYDSTLAWVKALNYKYIEDKDYLSKILSEYTDVNIHCVIVVHSPEGDRFFLEEGEGHSYIEIGSEEFLASLNSTNDELVNSFWLNLR